MANVVRDPRTHPEAIIPDLTKADPLLTFTKDEIALVYGSKWKQRYFKQVGEDYFVLPAQWDVTHKLWRPYFVKNGTDWWAPLYPADNMRRPTGPLCDGCHSVNYDIATKKVTEWNVGCEKCHGPGSDHVERRGPSHIINPIKLDYVQAADTCIQCHSQGQPLTNPIDGKYYDWPVGFHVGKKLVDFWKLEGHKLGELSFTHFPAGSAGSECIACHMPKIEQTIADVSVRAHTFKFITPAQSEALQIPNACNLCHLDKTPAWATGALKGWSDRSPWRMASG